MHPARPLPGAFRNAGLKEVEWQRCHAPLPFYQFRTQLSIEEARSCNESGIVLGLHGVFSLLFYD
jgi:hypothetical protein